MIRASHVALVLAVASACSAPEPGARRRTPPPARPSTGVASTVVRDRWTADIDVLRGALRQLDSAATELSTTGSASSLKRATDQFVAARQAFKRTEFLTTYYAPTTTKTMNGPALPRVDDEEGPEIIFPPEGFQVIEELLYADAPDSARAMRVSAETRNLIDLVTRLHTAATNQVMTDDRIFDAVKQEIARIETLGVSGFDSPVALHSLAEAAASVRGMRDALDAYRTTLGETEWTQLDSAFAAAAAVLSPVSPATDSARVEAFNGFDRLHFIARVANPLARAVAQARGRLGIGTPQEPRAFRMEAVTLFDSGAFSAEAFAPPGTERASDARVAVGRALFFDARLSSDGTKACSSCHDPARAFTDGRPRSMARSKYGVLRNAPTMINAGLQVGSFYDLRTTFLEDQVTDVLGNADEMHGNADAAATQLAKDSVYRALFTGAFGRVENVRGIELRRAIAAYIRSLQALNSPVDRALRGDTVALDREEQRGLNLFMGKARCGTCHFAPLFNGTAPPTYQESEVEVLGVPSAAVTRGGRIDPDSGRYRITRALPHLYAFKVPSVRNVALTAPYMHNGVYRTLEEVVDFYNRGGGAGIGVRLPNQTLPRDRLNLSGDEQRALVRFMKALTDTTGTMRR